MNVYDFDKTIYDGDSSADLIKYALLKHPAALLTLPSTGLYGLAYLLGLCKKERFKEKAFGFVRYVPDIDKLLDDFWAKHKHKIMDWYLQQKKDDDIIVSASSQFALDPICKSLNISVIATDVDSRTGKFNGPNCHGEEKVKRLRAKFPNAVVDSFYSDSRSDTPLARIAKKAYIVKRGKLRPW
ncbi:MAG: haloacid dehalogenase-like hydrolase [Papillibacter sp.]|nr:haloacid dehalogenase-like hydrolase [Papillibacter sp.]